MSQQESFWKLEHLSNGQLLESLQIVLHTGQRTLAELVAHLAEVEDRRLHLEAAYSSLFAYCVARLGMSEDEACRRIELARLARRFPALFAELASGRLTLSVALVLKPVLSPSNHLELLTAARGKSIRQARELVAEHFPKPDTPSSIRKLPEPRPMQASLPAEARTRGLSSAACPALPFLAEAAAISPSSAADLLAADPARPSPQIRSLVEPPVPTILPTVPTPSLALPAVSLPTVPTPLTTVAEPSPERPERSSPAVEGQPVAPRTREQSTVSRNVIEPLSAQRYRIQFTADAALKQQLEQARDLLRHAHPSGDFGPIVSRALKLLIDDLLRRRFGARAARKPQSAAVKASAQPPSPAPASGTNAPLPPWEEAQRTPATEPASPVRSSRTPTCSAPGARSHIPRAARRTVLERDGLGCSWVGPNGECCSSQAWLELDHRHPAGKGGGTEPENLRLLCRAHNQLAAERTYGRKHIERTSRRRRELEHSPRHPV